MDNSEHKVAFTRVDLAMGQVFLVFKEPIEVVEVSDRKETIIKEIRYWKEHHLLPAQYCDFLLKLYTEGEEEPQQTEHIKQAKTRTKHKVNIARMPFYFLLFILFAQLPITFLVIYFTELSFLLQIGLFSIFIGVSVITGIIYYRKKDKWMHLPIITGSLVLFLATVHLMSTYVSTSQWALVTVILFNCMTWTLIGWKTKLTYLLIAGISSAVLLVSYSFL
ncbi:hypothetical protein LC040_11245 [Bacillus tianshenii]|nr:hypothetical protein LC040_11245 [Bacillus tianshenii]